MKCLSWTLQCQAHSKYSIHGSVYSFVPQIFIKYLLPVLGVGPGVARKKETNPLPVLMELTL